jgi:hypothetical protein
MGAASSVVKFKLDIPYALPANAHNKQLSLRTYLGHLEDGVSLFCSISHIERRCEAG